MYLVDFAVEMVVMVLSSDSMTTLFLANAPQHPGERRLAKTGNCGQQEKLSIDVKQRAIKLLGRRLTARRC